MPAPGPDKALCGAQLPNQPKGRTCRQVAGWKTDHLGVGSCIRHGGATPTHAVNARRARISDAAAIMGVPADADPADGMLEMFSVALGQERWLRDEVADLDRHALTGPVGGSEHGEPRYEPNVLIRMHTEAIDRVTRVAKACRDAGIADARIELERAHGERLAEIIRAVVIGLGRRLDEPEVQTLVRGLLSAGPSIIEGTEAA